MHLLNRYSFIEAISHISSANDPHHTLIYTEINKAPKIASLVQGLSAEEKLITSIQWTIYNYIKDLPNACMGKLGWNRFAVILKLSVNETLGVAEELAKLLDSQSVDIDGVSYYPKLVIGVTPLSPEYESPERILAAVDEALFQARRTGNSIVKLIQHDDPILHNYYDSLKLMPEITEGLKNESFILYAQPIVPINQSSLDVKKYEVLLRYRNEHGAIDPQNQLLKTAEVFNVDREIDFYVVHQFCRFISLQKNSNRLYSLNISGSTIRYTPFIDIIIDEFEKFGVNPKQVCFEITETVMDRDFEQAIEFMNLLKDRLGCGLSIDDIGIGSSNLANLAKFNVDYMKIDGSFITNFLNDPYSELVVRFITSAAKIFGRKTIAEYVENAEQLKKLAELGVDYAQGYFTGKPELLFDPASMPR